MLRSASFDSSSLHDFHASRVFPVMSWSHVYPCLHSRCMTILALRVNGAANPIGSNTVHICFRMFRFVGERFLVVTFTSNVSLSVFHRTPRALSTGSLSRFKSETDPETSLGGR